jgi:ectoine hydroxylase-related dioxygenase (phytanoyl-CoA dioxygenase family)
MLRPVFKDTELEKEFQREGYIHLSFLSPDDVQLLWNEFHRLIETSGGNMTPQDINADIKGDITYDFTFIDRNIEYKKAVLKTIDKIFKPYYDKILNNYKPIIANYIRKKTDTGEVPLHQNWAFIDEKKATSVSIWVPLIDSHRGNGALEVVPKSHKRFGEVRGPMVPWELEGIKEEIIKNDLVTCDIKAGEAIILDDSIVHYSFPNTTNNLRIAIQLILIPDEMPSIHYHMDPQKSRTEIDVIEVEPEFYMQFNPWKKPENVTLLKKLHFDYHPVSHDIFQKKLKQPRFDESTGFIQKLKSVFS